VTPVVTHRSQRDWSKYNVESMGRDELLTLLQELAQEMDSIRAQIDDAKAEAAANGVYSDRDWFRRANVALRARGRFHQRIQMRLSSLRRAERAENARQTVEHTPLETHFMRAAKEVLPRETYERIMQLAHGRMSHDHSA